MDELPPLTHLPLVPEQILRQHHVYEPSDTRFRACARLLQALWREDRDLPIGNHISPDGKRRKLGSRISTVAGRAGANFLASVIAGLVRREVIYREIGALIDEHRLWTNLLSSMPLCFNLLGPLHLNLGLASRVLRLICPDLGEVRVHAVKFEHSPGRGLAAFTGDGTAFDALIRYETSRGRRGFVAIEVKYSETGHEPAPPTLRSRYDEIADVSGLFAEPSSQVLRRNPLQHFFREHCLAQALLIRGDYDEGRFIVITPKLNHLVHTAMSTYQNHLLQTSLDQASFSVIPLEHVIAAIAHAGEADYARTLYRRYCDFWLIDGEIELALAETTPLRHCNGDPEPRPVLKLIKGGRS
jgi:hypothetical protein